jgi:hypothetical protein
MGRRKKYNTEQERTDAQREWSRAYYAKNSTSINEKRMKKYYERKFK